jgi:hypothetical protein
MVVAIFLVFLERLFAWIFQRRIISWQITIICWGMIHNQEGNQYFYRELTVNGLDRIQHFEEQ